MSSCLCCDLHHELVNYFILGIIGWTLFSVKKITVVFLGLYGSSVQVQVAQYSVL